MITSPLLTAEVLNLPMINIVSYLKEMRIEIGKELIDLSVGNPDLPPCDEAIETLSQVSKKKNIHGYGNFDGRPELLESIKNFYFKHYHVSITDKEINVVRGVRNLLFTISYIFVKPGDTILIPSIGYQSYYLATIFNHAVPYMIPINESNGYVPDLKAIPESVLKEAKLLYLNYPNNPTGAFISREQLTAIVETCRKYNILICYDNAYNEILFDGNKPFSIMEIPGAKDVCVEIISMSKLTCLAGWRIAFCVANEQISRYIWNYNAVTDSAVYDGFQIAGAVALNHVVDQHDSARLSQIYQHRRDIMLKSFDTAGIEYYKPEGGFYIWLNTPDGMTDIEYSRQIARRAKVLLTPGSYYGDDGVHNIRVSLTADEDTLRSAAERISALNKKA